VVKEVMDHHDQREEQLAQERGELNRRKRKVLVGN